MNRRIRLGIIALFLYGLFCVIAGIFVAESTLHPQRRLLDIDQYADDLARRTQSARRDVSIRTQDNLILRAWLIQPISSNGSAVLLLHGLGDNRIGMTGYAELFLNHGYTVLLPDARAQGQSDGTIATYGLLESRDVHDWAAWLTADLHPQCIYGLGESMGASQLLQSLNGDPTFCAVVAESPFSSLREIGFDRVGQFFHTGPWLGRTPLRPIVEFAFLYSRWKYGFDLNYVSPLDAVSKTRTPVLLIHGAIDSNIPLRHSQRIKSAAPSVILWEVPGADHCGAISAAPEEFERRVLDWFTSHPPPPMSPIVKNLKKSLPNHSKATTFV